MIQQIEFSLPPCKRGFHLITSLIEKKLESLPEKGLLHIHIKHTSAGITINENADPTVRLDFETFFNKLIPENSNYFKHTSEGSDDMPSHLKASIIGQNITIPITNYRMNLGTWQGIYFCEFRDFGGDRKIVLTMYS
ncbi:MAG: secondary thiamine-phosphate synthase [Bacteroidetes bacterium RIFOXYA12_FULL_35_11]|nr:MAG: secondary thiamine-phosphate synthase [Bacteroidetes bacterium GWF2_35_48]OFY78911.1 MAG: secondary thiamine-phosphate synthase [Bacteroidetes bacterium RIFOXYA12_FULL_35_11]OFY93614.1 MAG: secondary thiamine-phosphate synthase [Bacteroidetes bacterium RIFOXYC12_FULL_35_7]OFY96994.1 MAG: secondary thiamine-phosphate synthase [Bacteroidetes bacterium RIFOXYB2_FULL_35_7]HBX49668.1 secondary thiamine-phosphate synthase [Bacteroidales bacterium]